MMAGVPADELREATAWLDDRPPPIYAGTGRRIDR